MSPNASDGRRKDLSMLNDTVNILQHDEPITHPDNDLLGRSPLALHLAAAIRAIDHDRPMVLAIDAPWGAGKTSFVNLVRRGLTEERLGASVPTTVFNPWHFTGVNPLVESFFTHLLSVVPDALRAEATAAFRSMYRFVATSVAFEISGYTTALPETAFETTLIDEKRKLDALFGALDHRIVVFIDDIDHLDREATSLLFRLIKLIADFRNITYVLSYDEERVATHLSNNGVSGREYLDKAIQVSFGLPSIPQSIRAERIEAAVGIALSSMSIGIDKEDLPRFRRLLEGPLAQNLQTLRDLKRYLNALTLTLKPVRHDVDALDFMAVELLRVFHPASYAVFPQFTYLYDPGMVVSNDARRHELLKSLSGQPHNEPYMPNAGREAILQYLFPILERAR